jgi:2-(3-amino-3-carboxypropyl)histidine synthase
MNILKYSVELESLINTIKEKEYRFIGLQVPEGLKNSADVIVDNLESKTGVRCVILADPCFGACGTPLYDLESLGVDCLVHIGHIGLESPGYHSKVPIYYVGAYYTGDVVKVVEKSLKLLDGKRVGLVTTAQHIRNLDAVRSTLTRNGFEPVMCAGDGRVKEPGCILGCDLSAGLKINDKVDSYLFIGSGFFHPVGLSLCVDKTVVAADPYTNTVNKDEIIKTRDRILRQRYGAITQAKNAKVFGVLIGLKPGQRRLRLANKIHDTLRLNNKKSYLIALEVFTPLSLAAFNSIDCYVSTACPRIAIDDYSMYNKPLITPVELEIALGLRSWSEYCFDQMKD